MAWILVGAGGAIGAIARHGLNGLLLRLGPVTPFPYGIFVVNVVGSLAIGLLAGLATSTRFNVSDDARLFLAVGVLGGFTTFSSFSFDTLTLVRDGHVGLALANAVGQVVLSLVAVAVGYRLAS